MVNRIKEQIERIAYAFLKMKKIDIKKLKESLYEN